MQDKKYQKKDGAWDKPGMVDWYSPSQLADTGLKTLISTILGERLDTRLIDAAGTDSESIYDYRKDEQENEREEVVFDFMADTGDGWDTTYTMAYLLTDGVSDSGTEGDAKRRSDFTIMGGDEVYPVSSRELYAKRLVWPFNNAARKLGIDPKKGKEDQFRDIYLVPGNHDWYDNLAAFTRRFLSGRRLGAFQTRQKRSYFAIKLPGNWHLWAGDIQLGKDVDLTQLKFFEDYAANLTSEDKVILCSAEPAVVYGLKAASKTLLFTQDRLRRAAEQVKEEEDENGKPIRVRTAARVPIMVAGDVHNYQRYQGKTPTGKHDPTESYDQVQIVSGGGGAFLHPTHSFCQDPDQAGGFTCKERYPPEKVSQNLGLKKNLLFPFYHPGMAFLIGALLLAIFWSLPKDVDWWRLPIEHPFSFILMLVAIGGTYAFSGARNWKIKIAGLLHGVLQILAGCLCWRFADCLAANWVPSSETGAFYVSRVILFVSASLLSGFIFGAYLIVSLNWLFNHHNEAFSALGHEHHKHFCRFRVEKSGELTVEVIAVPKTAGEEANHPVKTEVVDSFTVS